MVSFKITSNEEISVIFDDVIKIMLTAAIFI